MMRQIASSVSLGTCAALALVLALSPLSAFAHEHRAVLKGADLAMLTNSTRPPK